MDLSGFSLLSSVLIMPSYGGPKPLEHLVFAFHGSIYSVILSSEYSIQGKRAIKSQSFSAFSVTEVSIAPKRLLWLFSALLSILKIFKNRGPGTE